ncbi:MAG: metal-dependent transcriptional regulator [Gemmatimonadota bacterium]|nr:metal-dependent transcriptional regulator [Gemmatimonadota bacterium]
MDLGSQNSAAVEDYLKAILELARPQAPVSTSAIAKRLGVSPAAVTAMLKRLSDQALVNHVPYYGVQLTAAGEHEAARVLRRHRVLELFLFEVLEYTWDEVHAEAERLEHSASDALIEAMLRFLNHPTQDPHGAPIPGPGRPVEEPRYPSLWELAAGCRAVLRRVGDRDPEFLRSLASLEMLPGAELEVLERPAGEEVLRVRCRGRERVLGREMSQRLQVEPLTTTPAAEGELHA